MKAADLRQQFTPAIMTADASAGIAAHRPDRVM